MADGLFSLSSPAHLFEKAKRDSLAFHEAPSPDNLFNLLCTLNHLRDWICPGGHESYEARDASAWSRSERLHHDLYGDHDFQIVRDLCNNAKHFADTGIGSDSKVIHGFFVGYNSVGDFLDHPNYFTRGRDLREVIRGVFAKYEAYFKAEA